MWNIASFISTLKIENLSDGDQGRHHAGQPQMLKKKQKQELHSLLNATRKDSFVRDSLLLRKLNTSQH